MGSPGQQSCLGEACAPAAGAAGGRRGSEVEMPGSCGMAASLPVLGALTKYRGPGGFQMASIYFHDSGGWNPRGRPLPCSQLAPPC